MDSLISLKAAAPATNEAEVEVFAVTQLKKAGYSLSLRKCKSALLNSHWPSKTVKAIAAGYPDILLYLGSGDKPVCVWENKGPLESAESALTEAKFYIEGLRKKLPHEPALPFLAAGYNGDELKLAAFNNAGKWVSIKSDGVELKDAFPTAAYLHAGINSQGVFVARTGAATAADLRALLPKLKTVYRNIPILSSGRVPVDFTVALLTLKLVIEQQRDWGSWSEMPRFSPGSKSVDHGIGERLQTFANRILSDPELKAKYGDIFSFHEKSDVLEVAFAFSDVLGAIPKGIGNFDKIFQLLDELPPLTGADFDIFGEVYQAIGDEATKRSLGEFFTGRHIIAGVLPVLFHRSGLDKSFESVRSKKLVDIACGTGGFLTEMLRFLRRTHKLKDSSVKAFARKAFYGYDLGPANASRARVNMYFAGDGFSAIKGGFDSLSNAALKTFTKIGIDVLATNPPYGMSAYGRTEEAFLLRCVAALKAGTGWGCVVLPTGVLENPRSASVRFSLLNLARVTDVISLPKHAFAPYTQQRTGVIIFQKRKKPLVAKGSTWDDLIAASADETVSMFIVDNDGYANSDKRYPTDRRAKSGEWLHNDLADWTDTPGLLHESKLVRAAVNQITPHAPVNEKGEPLERKYGAFRIGELADEQRGLALLPDILLRDGVRSLPLDEWQKRVQAVLSFSRGEDVSLPLPFKEEVEALLDHTVSLPKKALGKPASIVSMFTVTKGDQGLTESMIYKYMDTAEGLPVYGGGAGIPRFKAKKGLKRLSGEDAACFEGPALVVSMDGSSGSIQVIDEGSFYCNHHGAVLKPKGPTNLWCFVQFAEPALKRLASNKGGSATLTKPALEELQIRMPADDNDIGDIDKNRRALTTLSRLIR